MPMASAPTHVKGDITRHHACLLCDKEIKFEKRFIKAHLQQVHKTDIENYEEQFSAELDSWKRKQNKK